jgi:hypothetical protein
MKLENNPWYIGDKYWFATHSELSGWDDALLELRKEGTLIKNKDMSYLERMKEGQRRVIEHAQSQIDEAQMALEKLEYMVHPTNSELYQSMSRWDIVNVGRCSKIIVPQNILISPEQVEILCTYVRDTGYDEKEYGFGTSLEVEVDRFSL